MITTFFFFAISISDHQMMDFKQKNHYKSVELTNNACITCDSEKTCYVIHFCFLDNRFISIFT